MHTETETQTITDIPSIGTAELSGLTVMEHTQEVSPCDEADTNLPESQVQPAENTSTAEPPAAEEIVKETAKDPVSQTSQEEIQKPSAASLWCSKNGRSHAHLAEWDILKCPSCEQDLRRPEEEVKKEEEPEATDQPKPDSDESESESESEDEAESADEADTADESHDDEEDRPCLQYSISYLDEAGYHAATEPWHERLDLNTERKHVVKNTNVVVEIETIVQTNIRRDSARLEYEKDKLLVAGILKNPAYRLAILKSQFVIHSKLIMRTLMHLVDYYPAVNLSPEPITITEPYPLIIHHWDVIQAYLKTFPGHKDYQEGSDSMAPFPAGRRLKACDEETHQHFVLLIESIEPSLLEQVRDEKALWSRSVPMATFSMLWLLYKPGTDVYIDADGDIRAGVVKAVTHQIRHVPGSSAVIGWYRIDYWYLDFDGRRLGRAESSRYIVPYEGEQEITTLSIYPCSFIDDKDDGATRRRLEDRGEQFFKLLGGAQMEYKGESLGEHKRWYEGRVMIDIATYYNTVEDQKFSKPYIGKVKDKTITEGDDYDDDDEIEGQKDPTFKWACYDNINPKVIKTLDLDGEAMGVSAKHRYFLCPKRVIGFILKSRKWDLLDIECCHQPRVNYKAIDSLVLNEERKTMIKSLVYRYTDKNRVDPQVPAPWAADTIRDKGEGQIFLLHGGPGVGKTFTAECIAESTGRPLLSLTCADIGTEDKEVEERLSDWFSLAETWGAVMLLDEADVFLERRNRGDLARNSLVSVFLRSMEYYRGILFLTTNRVGHFDDAFISRIHIVIKYDNFDMASRERIWSQFFKKLATERGKYITISNDAKKYVTKNKEMISIPWNGREIRNAFQTAVALAEYRFAMSEDKEEGDKACLEREDFQQVCEMTGAFKKYLKSLSGGFDEAGRALNDEARIDNLKEED